MNSQLENPANKNEKLDGLEKRRTELKKQLKEEEQKARRGEYSIASSVYVQIALIENEIKETQRRGQEGTISKNQVQQKKNEKEKKGILKGALNALKVAGRVATVTTPLGLILAPAGAAKFISDIKRNNDSISNEGSRLSNNRGSSTISSYDSSLSKPNSVKEKKEDLLDSLFTHQASVGGGVINNSSGSLVATINDRGGIFDAKSMNMLGEVREDGTILDKDCNVAGYINPDGYVVNKDGRTLGRIRDGFFSKH